MWNKIVEELSKNGSTLSRLNLFMMSGIMIVLIGIGLKAIPLWGNYARDMQSTTQELKNMNENFTREILEIKRQVTEQNYRIAALETGTAPATSSKYSEKEAKADAEVMRAYVKSELAELKSDMGLRLARIEARLEN